MSRRALDLLPLYAALFVFILANIALWSHVRPLKARWMNVPPAPSIASANTISLGDPQMAYRIYGITIQNFGDTGGRTTALKDYDYEALGTWLRLGQALDPKSDFLPYIAAFVFGGSQDPSKLGPVIDYLEQAGGDGQGEKWRWLAHAAHLARFKMKDMPRALELANKLAAISRPDMPLWTKQLPVFIKTESGDKAGALAMMMAILESGVGKLQPQEINSTIIYICTNILTPEEAKTAKLCAENALTP